MNPNQDTSVAHSNDGNGREMTQTEVCQLADEVIALLEERFPLNRFPVDKGLSGQAEALMLAVHKQYGFRALLRTMGR